MSFFFLKLNLDLRDCVTLVWALQWHKVPATVDARTESYVLFTHFFLKNLFDLLVNKEKLSLMLLEISAYIKAAKETSYSTAGAFPTTPSLEIQKCPAGQLDPPQPYLLCPEESPRDFSGYGLENLFLFLFFCPFF